MKSNVKKIIVGLIFVLIIFIFVIGKKYTIIDNVLENELKNTQTSNYSLEIKFDKNLNTEVVKKSEELGFIFEHKDGNDNILSKSIYNKKESKIYHIDFENKNIEIEKKEIDSDSIFYTSYFNEYMNKSFGDKIKYAVVWNISKDVLDGKSVYYIDNIENTEIWIGKENYEIVKTNSKLDDMNEKIYKFEKDCITEKDFKLPENINEYTIIEK